MRHFNRVVPLAQVAVLADGGVAAWGDNFEFRIAFNTPFCSDTSLRA